MIREDDLREAIAECQGERNPNANTCIKLAAYYTILKEIRAETNSVPEIGYSYEPPKEYKYESGSEFGTLIAGKNLQDVMPVVDEIVMTLKLFNPRLYEAAMRKLSAL